MKDTNKTYDEKITDRAFSQSFWISIFSILLYVIMLCSVSYAWFTASLSSGGNEIKSASFAFSVTHNDGEQVVEYLLDPTALDPNTGKPLKKEFTLTSGERIEIKMTEDSSATKAYCVVSLNDDEYTFEILRDKTVVIYVTVASSDELRMTLEPRWGRPAEAQDIIEESEFHISLNP